MRKLAPRPGITVVNRFISPITLCLVTAPPKPEARAKADAEKGVRGSVHDSLPDGGCKVDSLPCALSDFLEPGSRVGTVNHAAEKAQPFGCIIAVSPDVVLRDLGVQSEKGIQVPGFGKDVSRVAKLRGFDDHGFLNIEDVFIPKQIDPARPA